MPLTILSAGVAGQLVSDVVQRWNVVHPDNPAEFQRGYTVDLARKIIAGEACDFFVSADDTVITAMLIPRYTDECTVFARNRMVLACARPEAEVITKDNWKEKLSSPNTRFAHYNPYTDPGGYRGLMGILLADKVEPGLTDKLMNHPGHIGMDKNLGKDNMPLHDYIFTYYSSAVASGLPFAELPEVINFGNPELESVYNSVCFDSQIGGGTFTVKGTYIRHACAILKSGAYLDSAREFKKLFMESDFSGYDYF
jgi:ABC-type molybdate transport system substrate-binding protein